MTRFALVACTIALSLGMPGVARGVTFMSDVVVADTSGTYNIPDFVHDVDVNSDGLVDFRVHYTSNPAYNFAAISGALNGTHQNTIAINSSAFADAGAFVPQPGDTVIGLVGTSNGITSMANFQGPPPMGYTGGGTSASVPDVGQGSKTIAGAFFDAAGDSYMMIVHYTQGANRLTTYRFGYEAGTSIDPTALPGGAVPEPGTVSLMLAGLGLAGVRARSRLGSASARS